MFRSRTRPSLAFEVVALPFFWGFPDQLVLRRGVRLHPLEAGVLSQKLLFPRNHSGIQSAEFGSPLLKRSTVQEPARRYRFRSGYKH